MLQVRHSSRHVIARNGCAPANEFMPRLAGWRAFSATDKDDKADPNIRELLAAFHKQNKDSNMTSSSSIKPSETYNSVKVGARKIYVPKTTASISTGDRRYPAYSSRLVSPNVATSQTFTDPIRDSLNKSRFQTDRAQPDSPRASTIASSQRSILDRFVGESPVSTVRPARPPVQSKFNTRPSSNIDKLTQANKLGRNSTGMGSDSSARTGSSTAYDSAALRERVRLSFAAGSNAAAGRRPGGVTAAGDSPRLQSLSRGLPTESSIEASDVPAEITENEWQHERKLDFLRRKKEQFDKARPPGPIDKSWEKGAQTGKSTVLDIAAMKQLYESRLKGRNGYKGNDQKEKVSSADKAVMFRVFNQLPGARKSDVKGIKDDKRSVSSGTIVKEVSIPDQGLSVRELSSRLSMKVDMIREELNKLGEDIDGPEFRSSGGGKKKKRMKRIQSAEGTGDDKLIDADVAELLVLELGFTVVREKAVREFAAGEKGAYSAAKTAEGTETSRFPPRDPIVCVMGHVDHGKTTLMDRLRAANVAADEAGGITQKLSAFSVNVGTTGRKAVFIDTPGHAAFGGMRSSGAAATDVVILVVAIDDGVRPQTAEVLKLVDAAKCTLVVALNKIDNIPTNERAAAKQRVLNQLMELGVAVEEYGGDVVCAEISGKSGDGIDSLLESLLLQTDVLELSAPTEGLAEATVLDSRFEKGKGVVADCLVRWGKLEVGDVVVVGTTYGHVKSMTNDAGARLKSTGPSTAIELLGLKTVPSAGQELLSVNSEEEAKQIVDRRLRVAELKKVLKEASKSSTERDLGTVVHAVVPGTGGAESRSIVVNSVDTVGVRGVVSATEAAKKLLAEQGAVVDETAMAVAESVKKATLNVILKADGVGTLEALQQIADGLNSRTDDARIRVINSSVGAIVKSDIDFLSSADSGVIFGFNIGFADNSIKNLAKHKKIDVVTNSIVYRLEDDMLSRLEKMMPMERRLESMGRAEVLKLFPLNAKVKTVVAGLNVTRGTLNSGKDYVYTVIRGGKDVFEDGAVGDATLRRFKDVVSSVASGLECGLTLASFSDFEEGDIIECFKVVHAVKVLRMHPDANSTEASHTHSYAKQ